MKQGGKPTAGGFTIVETLIVLAVTGILLVSAIIAINGRQNKTMFTTAINNLQQQVQQIINQTASGYFPNNNTFTCTAAGTGQPTISAGAGSGQGTNTNCVFLGKVVQFGVAASPNESFVAHAIAGNKSAITIAAANPVDINIPDILASEGLKNGLSVVAMGYVDTAGGSGNTAGVGFLAGDSTGQYASPDGGGGLTSGSQQLSLYAIRNTTIGVTTTTSAMATAINALGAGNFIHAKQVTVCVKSGTTNQSGLITIGGAQQRLSVTLDIKNGTVC